MAQTDVQPANFLDGGGGATEANVRAALEVVTSDQVADVVFVNSFGGLTKTVSDIADFAHSRTSSPKGSSTT
jgi:succinyl-CoA synthetase beta subunit